MSLQFGRISCPGISGKRRNRVKGWDDKMDGESKKTILIVDDVEMNCKMLSVILSEKYHTLEADNGKTAMEVLKEAQEPVSLILLDIIMPVMDGFQFLKWIQSAEAYRNIPIIFVTSETYEENILGGIKMGVRDVIAKPYNPDLVLKRVDNLILLSEHAKGKEKNPSLHGEEAVPQRPLSNTALIVDDIGINRAIIKNALTEEYKSLEASNGKEALEILEKQGDKIAVVLLDIIMPVMDGYVFMQEAKRQHLLKNIPVIAITSEDSPLKLDRLMNLGICEIIQKPFTPSVVKNRIDYMVKLQRCTK